MNSRPHIVLNNGVRMPQLGFGVFQIPDAETTAAVAAALAAGYRSIDTAAIYGNEAGTGRAFAESGIAREELFITSKLWIDDLGYEPALAAFDASLDKLGLDYLDLYLIHWPAPASDRYADSWLALEKLLADGRVRAIGVSNFEPGHLQRLIDLGGTVPAVNQVELHPALQQRAVTVFNAAQGIATEAWSPLAQGAAGGSGNHGDRRAARRHAGPGDAALAPAAGEGCHPQIGDSGPDQGEPRRVRLRPLSR